jgi:hypothetical protein
MSTNLTRTAFNHPPILTCDQREEKEAGSPWDDSSVEGAGHGGPTTAKLLPLHRQRNISWRLNPSLDWIFYSKRGHTTHTCLNIR